jgi:hypothetical protein
MIALAGILSPRGSKTVVRSGLPKREDEMIDIAWQRLDLADGMIFWIPRPPGY